MDLVVGRKRIGFLILPFNNNGSCCRYKENKFGMRWRLEKEVVLGENLFKKWINKICKVCVCSQIKFYNFYLVFASTFSHKLLETILS